jgi:hypothetical protein
MANRKSINKGNNKITDHWVWCLTPLSTNFSGGQFYWWSKMESTEKTTDLPEVTGKFYHTKKIFLDSHPLPSNFLPLNSRFSILKSIHFQNLTNSSLGYQYTK